jgi:hypothetical protein
MQASTCFPANALRALEPPLKATAFALIPVSSIKIFAAKVGEWFCRESSSIGISDEQKNNDGYPKQFFHESPPFLRI